MIINLFQLTDIFGYLQKKKLSSLPTLFLQVFSRVLVACIGIVPDAPYWNDVYHMTTLFLMTVWTQADVVRQWTLLTDLMVIKQVRQSHFYITYPLGISLELFLIYSNIQFSYVMLSPFQFMDQKIVFPFKGIVLIGIAYTILTAQVIGFPLLYSILMKNSSYALNLIRKKKINPAVTDDSISNEIKETNFSFGSQKVMIVFDSLTIEQLRERCLHLLALDRMKQTITNKSDGKVVTKLLPKDKEFIITKEHNIKLEDMNIQLSFTFVYVVEQMGPIVIATIMIIMFMPASSQERNEMQTLYGMQCIHQIKRTLETIFVHKFSRGTMPFENIIKNSLYYQLNTLFIFKQAQTYGNNQSTFWIVIWVNCQLLNCQCHQYLSINRKDNEQQNPKDSILFELFCCPHYTFEVAGWLVFAYMSGNLCIWMFAIQGAQQMYMWARSRQQKYKSLFGKEYTCMFFMLPIPFF